MKLSDQNRKILIDYLQQILTNYSKHYSSSLTQENTIVPSGQLEKDAVKAIKENPMGFNSYMERVLWNCSQNILFDLLCVIDGVADPDNQDWKGVLLIDMPEDYEENYEFLHDEF